MVSKNLNPILLLGGRRNEEQKRKYDEAEEKLRGAGFEIINPWEGMGDYWKCYTYQSKYREKEKKEMEDFWNKKLEKIKSSGSVVMLLTMPVAPGQIIESWEARRLGKEVSAIHLDKEYPNCTHLIKCFSSIYQNLEEFIKANK